MRRPLSILIVALGSAAVLAAGCGSAEVDTTPPAEPEPTGRPADFPAADGRTLSELRAEAGRSLVFTPSVRSLRKGTNRFGFALYDVAGKQLTGATVALYTARPDGSGVHGPFIARSESLKVSGPFRSRTTAADPDAAKAVYVADVTFHRWGRHVVTAIAKLDGRLVMTSPHSADVKRRASDPPEVGERAIRVHTRTLADVGGDASRLDTRTPPAADLLRTDLADVLGRKPVVITFATPALCQSRVCGPVVDIVVQAKSRAPAGVAWIHQEIWNDNDPRKGIQGPVAAWRLRTEPWTFVIDRSGRIAARFEGAFSAGELERAVAKVK
ncbi:MAG TPA: hypothetical protein VHF51_02525 [Solirubrobacteraceae bacterium]|nr:hypothetical protein [Solirubrobacteraceae bacterium]